jgi:hypothetical protein
LRGEHALLRAVRAEDADRLEEVLREPEVSRWWGGYEADAKRIVETRLRAVGLRPVGVMREYERGPDGSWHDGLLMDPLARELHAP